MKKKLIFWIDKMIFLWKDTIPELDWKKLKKRVHKI